MPLEAGLDDDVLEPPNKPPDAGVVLEAPPAPPKKPPEEGAADVGVEEALFAPPKRPLVDGVVEAPPNRPPEVGVEAVFDEGAPPNKPPAGFCASPADFWPKMEPALFEVALLPPVEPPAEPNENEGVPPEEAPPKRPPVAGAVVVGLFDGALDEPWVPKVNDMVFLLSEGLTVS